MSTGFRAAAPQAAERAERAWVKGLGLAQRGQWHDAVTCFDQAHTEQPGDVLYGLNLADALMHAGQVTRSLEVALSCLRAEPDNRTAFIMVVNARFQLGQFEELSEMLGSAPKAWMDHDLWVRLGVAQFRTGRPQGSIASFLKALMERPAEATVHYQLGVSFNEMAMKVEAAECFRTALVLGAGVLEVAIRNLLAFYEREVCQWHEGDDQVAQLRTAIGALPDNSATQTNPFACVTLLDDPHAQLKSSASCARFFAGLVAPLAPRAPVPRSRIRVGYASSDICRHATSYLLAELLERHDRNRFEVTLYSYGRGDGSDIGDRVRSAPEHFVDAHEMSARHLAQKIRADEIDILVDLKGYTKDSRPDLMAYRAAPVQAAYLGFPGTSGAEFIDYIVGDPFVTPMDHESWYSEKIAQVASCYQCNDGVRPLPKVANRDAHGLPRNALVLCAFNQAYKISPEVFDVWCRILKRLPDAVLWLNTLNDQAVPRLRVEAARRGLEPNRLIFAPTLPQAAHLDRIGCADLFLDTWPCNAHTTASDALWAGLPLVTYSGRTFASRVAGSLLHAIDMPDTVCDSVEAYEAKVLELAHDQDKRLAIRRHTEAARLTSPLFSGARIARDIEDLYSRMWDRALAGLPPEHLPALQVS
jgi:predicted O-linked N-acetylglucosamine transferase (SPINDLY family)